MLANENLGIVGASNGKAAFGLEAAVRSKPFRDGASGKYLCYFETMFIGLNHWSKFKFTECF